MKSTTARDESDVFDWIIREVYERSRIRLHDGKHALIRSRLARRLRHHGFESLTQYVEHLKRGTDPEEFTHLLDCLTTNFTHFLREEQHFKFLVGDALPKLIAPACATGEEPYSLALYLAEHFSPAAGWDWRIRATDISTRALGKAREGIYPADRLDTVPADWLRRNFQRGIGEMDGHYRVKPDLSRRIEFQHLNLLGSYPFNDRHEVIFCRNVMIYFDRPTQEQLVNHLAQHLVPGGYLLIGHSETLTGLHVPLSPIRPSIYRRTS
jgi:chemotaxis protein methyltransferase CheR